MKPEIKLPDRVVVSTKPDEIPTRYVLKNQAITLSRLIRHSFQDRSILSDNRIDLARAAAYEYTSLIPRPELFLIPFETMNALSDEELFATYRDMIKLNIAQLPYRTVDIGVPANMVLKLTEGDGREFEGWELKFRFTDDEWVCALLRNANGVVFDLHTLLAGTAGADSGESAAFLVKIMLVVLLATRNAVKTRVKDKMLAAGVKSAKRNTFRALYTTTITLPPRLPAETEGPGAVRHGYSLRPHLRRGHIRHQPYGPKLQFKKQIWIQPCFVNADEDFVSSRTAYNASITLNLGASTP